MIILFGGEKGGSGKTTLATNIAACRMNTTQDVLLIDSDRQATSSFWCSVREEKNILPRISSVQKYEKAVRTEILELNTRYTDIIVDAGGRDSPELRGSLLVSDIAIFPLRPSQFDLWTLGRLDKLVNIARDINEKLIAYILINMASPNPGVKEVEEMKDLIIEFRELKLLKSIIYERIIYRRAAIDGMGVTEYRPEDIKASLEIKNLYKELYLTELL